MKTIKQFHHDTFVDFKGNARQFDICLASVDKGDYKEVRVGFAICHEDDKYNQSIAERVSYMKAMDTRNNLVMILQHPGMINNEIGKCIMAQLAEYMKRDPGFQIKGYDDIVNDYHNSLLEKEYYDKHKKLIDALKELPQEDRDKILKLANES